MRKFDGAARLPGCPTVTTMPIGGTWFGALNVPRGTYYVRVRALGATGAGPASPDIVVTEP